ncbi:MAG: hypothetical protein ACYC0J_02045 [Gammaproteobacteria bacterium]
MSTRDKIFLGLIILLSGQPLIQILMRINFFDSVGHDYTTNKNAVSLCHPSLIKPAQTYLKPRETSAVLAELSIPATTSDCATLISYNAPKKCRVQPISADGKPGAYVLKEHDRPHMFWQPGQVDRTNALLIKFNQEFVCKNLGVRHATIKIFSIEDKIYSGSKFIPDFYSLGSYTSIFGRIFDFKGYDSSLIRKKFGDEPIRQLAVANTFIHDLNYNNVGFDKEGLVIIDIDLTPPNDIVATYLYVSEINFARFQFYLSLNDIIHMKEIYQRMQTIPLPNDPTQVGLSADVYEKLLKHSIEMCDSVYNKLKASILDMDTPNEMVNKEWIEELSSRFIEENHLVAQQMRG